MSIDRHTPGPWKASFNTKFGQWSILHSGWCERGDTSKFAQVLTSLDDEADAEKAHLLAAAPELLKALEACLPHVDASGFDPNGETSALARAAIAKARGTK